MILVLLAFLAGVVITAQLWRNQARLLSVSGAAALVLVVLLGILAVVGWPLYRPRLHPRPETTASEWLRLIHVVGGHFSTLAVAVTGPLLIGAAVRRPSSSWRKAVHFVVALFIIAAWLAASVSAYFLPRDLPNPLPPDLAPPVLRFAILHMVALPLLLGITLLFAGWRNLRIARVVAVV